MLSIDICSRKMEKGQIISRLQGALPGVRAHDLVMSYSRPSVEEVIQSDKEPRHSAVVFLVYPRLSDWHFLLLKRHDYKGVHSGQVGLPGGSLDEGETKIGAALREFQEETGHRLTESDLVSELSPLYIPPSNFIVHPYAAVIEEEPQWIFDEREVRRGIEEPLSNLLRNDNLEDSEVILSGGDMRIKVKSFPFGGETVWGATAMILSECKQILSNFEL